MKLVMTIPVHNHDYILAENIEYHRSLGVDAFIILIHNSSDRSREIVETYKNKVELIILDKNTKLFYDGEWRTEMAMIAREEMGADWIITNDVDEFWILEDISVKSLKEIFAEGDENVIYSHRYNVLPYVEDGKKVVSPPRSFTYTVNHVRDFDKNKHFSEITSEDFILKPLTGKAACATKGLHSIRDGSHEIDIEDKKVVLSTKLSILHFPFFTKERYINECRRRVDAGLREKYRGTRGNWHIQLMEHLFETGQFDKFIDGIFVSKERLEELIRSGFVEERTQVYNFFNRK